MEKRREKVEKVVSKEIQGEGNSVAERSRSARISWGEGSLSGVPFDSAQGTPSTSLREILSMSEIEELTERSK